MSAVKCFACGAVGHADGAKIACWKCHENALSRADAAEREVERLRHHLKLVEEAWEADKESAKWAQTCGCMVDKVTNVCMVHSPAVAREKARADRLAEALREIRDKQGRVCGNYELCSHIACASSYAAWYIAAAALKRETPSQPSAGATLSPSKKEA